MSIRDFSPVRDIDALRQCVVDLQDFERTIDSRLPAGEIIAPAYVNQMLDKCKECDGTIFVAEGEGEGEGNIVGFVTVLIKVRSDDIDDGDLEYALISDLLVRDAYRRTGLGRELLRTAVDYAKVRAARWLRIAVLARNFPARRLYRLAGFSEHCVDLEMDLAAPVQISGWFEAPSSQRVVPVLPMDDRRRALNFYVGALGFEILFERDQGPDSPNLMTLGKQALMITLSQHRSAHPGVEIHLYVDDIDIWHRLCVEKAIALMHAPKHMPWGTTEMLLVDPFRNVLRFSQGRAHEETSANHR